MIILKQTFQLQLKSPSNDVVDNNCDVHQQVRIDNPNKVCITSNAFIQ